MISSTSNNIVCSSSKWFKKKKKWLQKLGWGTLTPPPLNPPLICFHILEVLFLTAFCTSFWKKVHNSKEIVNLQGLYVLTGSYVDIKTYIYQLYYISTKYYCIIEGVYFIYRLFILFFCTLSFLLFLYLLHQGIREIASMPV